jgi:hypothetical protein
LADLRVVPAALVVCMALLSAGAGYAGEKINLVCYGTASDDPLSSKVSKYGPDGLIVDLDANTVTWGSDSFPIKENKGSLISFEGGSREDRAPGATTGTIDRITGVASISQHWVYGQYGERSAESTYDLTCKRTNPVF